MLFYKNVNEISEQDINNIVKNEVFEDIHLEYKSEYNHLDSIKFKLLKTVCGFSNSGGGLLIYGIKEDKNHVPSEITGIKLDNSFDSEVNWIESIVSSNSEPIISNIEIRQIKIKDSDNVILIIKVPKSWNLPHRVVQGKPNKNGEPKKEFFIRRQSKTVPLEIDELRNAFNFAGDIHNKMYTFRDRQISKILSNNTFVPINNSEIVLLVNIIPFESFSNISINIKELENQVPLIGGNHRFGTPNFEGIINNRSDRFTQIYRNGVIEGTVHRKFENIPLPSFCKSILNFINDSLNLYKKINIFPPIAIFISFINIKNCTIEDDDFHEIIEPIDDRNVLPSQEVIIDKYLSKNNIAVLLKDAFDSFYNHFGVDESPFYDDKGDWIMDDQLY